jgi:hypothetical protein
MHARGGGAGWCGCSSGRRKGTRAEALAETAVVGLAVYQRSFALSAACFVSSLLCFVCTCSLLCFVCSKLCKQLYQPYSSISLLCKQLYQPCFALCLSMVLLSRHCRHDRQGEASGEERDATL